MSPVDIPVLKHLMLTVKLDYALLAGKAPLDQVVVVETSRCMIRDVREDVPGGATWDFDLACPTPSGRVTWRKASVSKKYSLNQPSGEFKMPMGLAHMYYDERVYPDESVVLGMLKLVVLPLVQRDLHILKAIEDKLLSQ